jgi:high-affinity iron transporter
MMMIGYVAQSGAAEPSKGMALYRGHCAACHGIDGDGNGPKASGMTPPPTNFRNATVMQGLQDSQLERAILAGKPGTVMKGYGTILNPQDVAALVKYLRSLAATQ